MISLKTDTRLFDTGMIRAQTAAIVGTAAGMETSLKRFKNDALNKPPACPRKTGRTAKAHVTNVTVLGNRVIGSLSVVGVPYAASLHEGISRWGTPYVYKMPGTGMKWIESKALMYNRRYIRDILGRFSTLLKNALEVLR